MAEWIKITVGGSVTVTPLSFEDNYYNGNIDGKKYTCQNDVNFKASAQLHTMIQEFAPNQGIGQAITIGKKQVQGKDGRSFTPFTLNGKTFDELKNGGGMSAPSPVAPQPQVTPQVTPNMGAQVGSSLEDRVAKLEKEVLDLQTKDLF